MITGKIQAAKMIEQAIERAGLHLSDLVLEPIASSAAVLSEKEKKSGVVLIDIGGGTTDIAIFQDNVIRHSAVIPFGGQVITRDIQSGCHILEEQAEKLKTKFELQLAVDTAKNQVVSIPKISGGKPKEISVRTLAKSFNLECLKSLNWSTWKSGPQDFMINSMQALYSPAAERN